jgi:hypothetical protein
VPFGQAFDAHGASCGSSLDRTGSLQYVLGLPKKFNCGGAKSFNQRHQAYACLKALGRANDRLARGSE